MTTTNHRRQSVLSKSMRVTRITEERSNNLSETNDDEENKEGAEAG